MTRRGSVLVLVLFVLAILSLVGLSFAYRAGLGVAAARQQAVLAKLRCQAASAAALVTARLAQNTNAYDHPSEDWAQRTFKEPGDWLEDWKIEHGRDAGLYSVTVRVVDETGKLNVQYASSKQLEAMGLWADQVSAVMDWMDEDDAAGAGGAETPQYVARGYRCKNKAIDELEELLLVAGITPQQYYGASLAKPFCRTGAVAMAPGQSGPTEPPEKGLVEMLRCVGDDGINLNTAPAAVLECLPISAESVQQILAYRRFDADSSGELDDHALAKADDIDRLQGLTPADRETLKTIGRFRSDYFRIFVVARHELTGQQLGLEVLLDISEGFPRLLRWKETGGC